MLNPFGNPQLRDLTEADLQTLISNQVAEGYTVEYKEIPPDNKKIGRTLASFANTLGGWFIIGVEDDQNDVAKSVLGYDPVTFPALVSKIREITKSHISPVPLVETKVIRKEDGNEVLVVYIAPDQEPPYISSDGKIYRRTQASTEPVAETDRFAIDRLVDRGERRLKTFHENLLRDWTPTSGFKEGWLTIYIRPYPFGAILASFLNPETALKETLELISRPFTIFKGDHNDPITGSLHFHAIQLASDGVVVRIPAFRGQEFDKIAIELFSSGSAKIHIAIPFEYWDGGDMQFKFSEVGKSIRNAMKRAQLDGRLPERDYFNIGSLAFDIMMASAVAHRWMISRTNTEEVEIGAVLSDLGEKIPFMDSKHWAGHVEIYGLPLVGSD